PILSDDNRVLGTFAMYYREPRLPSPEHIQLIDMATQMARVAIEARSRDEALRESEARFREIAENLSEAQRVARLGSLSFDIETNRVQWSDALYLVFDVERTAFAGSYETFLSRVFPGNRARVLAANAVARSSGAPFELEYRITTRAGDVRHIREVG